MKILKKILFCTIIATLLLNTLTGCSSLANSLNQSDAEILVKGYIDKIYLGKFGKTYMEMCSIDLEQARSDYEDGIELEAEYFANYWGIVNADYGESYYDLDEKFQDRIKALYMDIYSHTKYEILSVAQHDKNTISVNVKVYPLDIMQTANDYYENNKYGPLNAFWEKYADLFSTITDAQYVAYTYEYGDIILQMLEELVDEIGYTEPKTQCIQIELIDGYWTMNEDDLGIFDSYVIYYP